MISRVFVAHVVQHNNSGAIKTVSRSRDELFMCFTSSYMAGFGPYRIQTAQGLYDDDAEHTE
jgi:hypothetical protein